MVNYLFINSLILIAFIFLGASIEREIPKSLNRYDKLILGISGGILGIIMIIYHYKVPGTATTVDLRLLALMAANYAGGFTPAFVAGIMIAVFRTGYYGISLSSIAAVIQICACLIFFVIMNKTNRASFKTWLIKLFTVLVILVSTYFYLLNGVAGRYLIILNLSLAIITMGIIEYFLLQYVRTSNELYRKYEEDSTKDYLTGLHNSRSFGLLAEDRFERAKINNEKVSCLMIDIDHFKKVNDTYGHASGDMVIKELAMVIKKGSREFDIIGRVGGEEFCVLLSNCSSELSMAVGQRLINAVREHKFPIDDGRFINITVSIGASTYPDDASDLKSVMENADEALYKAKQTGRDKVCSNKK